MRILIFVLFTLAQYSAIAQNHIVLFAEQELSISSLGHSGLQNLLQSTNDKSVKQLKEWMGARKLRSTVGDLWLVRGARVDLTPETATALAKEPWVSGVVVDQQRQFVEPPSSVGARTAEVPETPWGLKAIGLDKIREHYPQLDGSGVRVGILDTGIQSRHPEFLRGKRHVPVVFKDFLNPLIFPYDDHGHGTHVAGTIAGVNVGIAPAASLVVGKVFTAGGSGFDSAILEAMQWAYDPDGDPETDDFPQLISNSWGAGISSPGPVAIEQFAAYRRAVLAWIQGGIFPVFAAGNSGGVPNGIPGGLPESLAVGAIQSDGSLADFSSRGPNLWNMGTWVLSLLKPDISAPGVEVTSAFPGNEYATWSGTSMATPHVSGLLTLMLQANPRLTFAKAKAILLASSQKKLDLGFGYGIVDGYEAVRQVLGDRRL
ncbi:MAG: S8 family serine peptidase [Bdellovibrionaceae bacterium]|nr:S8 family serine peptidase [Bdellovibrionales bacterium]MCB9255238.1 S8 family serine peptidase [Pseudobdellovibrionaceae bacterium]